MRGVSFRPLLVEEFLPGRRRWRVRFPGAAQVPFRSPTSSASADAAEQAQLCTPGRRCGVRQHPSVAQRRRRSRIARHAARCRGRRRRVDHPAVVGSLPDRHALALGDPRDRIPRSRRPSRSASPTSCRCRRPPVAIHNILLNIALTAGAVGPLAGAEGRRRVTITVATAL